MTTSAPKIELVDPAAPAPSAPPSPFDDLESLRIDQNFAEQVVATKLLTTVPVGKPNAQVFVRVRPEPEYAMSFPVIELKHDRKEFYIVSREFAPLIPEEVSYRTLFTAITRQRVLSIWPIRLPSPDGRKNEWAASEREAAERAMGRWVRVTANMQLGANEIHEAAGNLGAPEWPAISYADILKIAFKNSPVIADFDHPVMKLLRGSA